MKQDLTEYIADRLKEIYPFFQWKVQNNSLRHTVELFVTFRVDLDGNKIALQDKFGTNLTTDYIQFEDVIAFYDPIQSDIQRGNYLTVIEMDNTLGIDKGQVDVVLKHLIRVASAGVSDLRDFIEKDERDQFEMKWNQHNYERALDTMKSLNRYNEDKLFMNFEEESSIVKELTEGNRHDGVERI
ncbi:MAG TPA: DUF3013 family protein [Alloiococcus sp.]|nr:DUF3013 family protein [Alloiococcus sp.]